MNLSSYVQTTVLYNSTDTTTSATGVAIAMSTAGSSGTGALASGPGGFPWCSTAIQSSLSMAGYEGVRFTAAFNHFSTGLAAGTSGIVTLQAYFAKSSTDAPTNWIAIKDAYALGYSSGGGSQGIGSTIQAVLQVDVYRPRLPVGYQCISAVVQMPSSSGAFVLIADRYGPKVAPFAFGVASTSVNGLQTGGPTTGKGPILSVSGTT